MGRDPRDSYRDRPRNGSADDRNGYDRSTPPRGARAGTARPSDPRGGATPPRSSASMPSRAAGRAGSPSDPSGRRPASGNGARNGNGNGGGPPRRPPVAGGPGDDGDRRSGPYSATGARGPRSAPSSSYDDTGSRTPERRRSMADMARDVSRSMSRQLSAVVSRAGHAVRGDGPPPPAPRGPRTPARPSTDAMLAAETVKLRPQAYRRSRSRLVARKWRRGRIQRNPALYLATVLMLFVMGMTVVAGGGAGGAYAFSYYQSHYSDVLAVTELQNQQNSTVYDRNGNQIAVLKSDNGNLNFYLPLKQISPKVQWATIDTEDRNFYSALNIGIDFVGTTRAALSNASSGTTQGGSTITQQLVKNIVIKDSKQTLDRKLHEAILAIGVNNSYTKQQILEFYLNSVYYHPFLYRGVEAASRYYFHLTPRTLSDGHLQMANEQLDWAQAALLAAVPNNPALFFPTQYTCDKAPCPHDKWDNPYVPGQECTSNFAVNGSLLAWAGDHGHEWLAYCRALLVLGNVLQYQGTGISFTQADLDKAKAELMDMFEKESIFTFNQAPTDVNQGATPLNLAPHFVEYVASIMQHDFGVDNLEAAGLKIYTTLDLNLNNYAQQQLKYYIQKNHLNPWYGHRGPGTDCGVDGPTGILIDCPLNQTANAFNGAVVAMNQYNGDILAMVGSVDYNDKDPRVAGAVNIATSRRSMGSATKPLVYTTAFQMGWTPATMLQDETVCFPTPIEVPKDDPTAPKPYTPAPACKGWYVPTNYTENEFSGNFPVRYNVGNSLNIGATETMAFVGDGPATSGDFLTMMQRLGVTTLERGKMGPTTALGTQDIPLIQLTGAYATFANLGKRAPARAILHVEDSRGNTLYDAPAAPKAEQVISPQASYMMTSVLTDNKARTFDFGYYENPLHFEPKRGEPGDFAIAAKTGTSSGPTGPRDIITAGYSPYLTVGVWIGNSNSEDMASHIIGVAGAGYVFHDVMYWAYKNYHWPEQAQFPVPPDLARAAFNCTTGLAPYKNEKPADLDCQHHAPDYLPAGAISPNLYFDTHGPNEDWYIPGSEPVHS